MRSTTFGFLGVLLVGCSGTSAPQSGTLSITANSVLMFDATYREGDDWARVLVRYSPDTTFYNLTTSFGSVPLAYAGTAPGDADILNAVVSDPRSNDGFMTLSPRDPEYAIVQGLHNALLGSGTNSRPTVAQKGTTLYAASYTTARVLGLVHLIQAGDDSAADAVVVADGQGLRAGLSTPNPDLIEARDWPYPGYASYAMMPPELRAPVDNQNFANAHCCGPHECKGGNYWSGHACDDWCAAGDSCNHRGLGSCGDMCPCGSPGCGCPHSNSSRINSYNSGPCNTRAKNYVYHVYSASPKGNHYVGCH